MDEAQPLRGDCCQSGSAGVRVTTARCTSPTARRATAPTPSRALCRDRYAHSSVRGSGSAETISEVISPTPPMTSPAASKAADAKTSGRPFGRPVTTKQSASGS